MALVEKGVKNLDIGELAEGEVWRLEDAKAEYWLMMEGNGVFDVWRRERRVSEQYARFLGQKVCRQRLVKLEEKFCITKPDGTSPICIIPKKIERSHMGDIPQAGILEDEQLVSRFTEFDITKSAS